MTKFNPHKINTSEFSSTLLNKPDGCFWASPVDAKYGWAAWATFNLPEYKNGEDKLDIIATNSWCYWFRIYHISKGYNIEDFK